MMRKNAKRQADILPATDRRERGCFLWEAAPFSAVCALKNPRCLGKPRFLRPSDARNARKKSCGIRAWGSVRNPGRREGKCQPCGLLGQRPKAPRSGAAKRAEDVASVLRDIEQPGRPCTPHFVSNLRRADIPPAIWFTNNNDRKVITH